MANVLESIKTYEYSSQMIGNEIVFPAFYSKALDLNNKPGKEYNVLVGILESNLTNSLLQKPLISFNNFNNLGQINCIDKLNWYSNVITRSLKIDMIKIIDLSNQFNKTGDNLFVTNENSVIFEFVLRNENYFTVEGYFEGDFILTVSLKNVSNKILSWEFETIDEVINELFKVIYE